MTSKYFLYRFEECCATCEHWIKTYEECEHPEQYQSESGTYMSPPEKYCELWETIKQEG